MRCQIKMLRSLNSRCAMGRPVHVFGARTGPRVGTSSGEALGQGRERRSRGLTKAQPPASRSARVLVSETDMKCESELATPARSAAARAANLRYLFACGRAKPGRCDCLTRVALRGTPPVTTLVDRWSSSGALRDRFPGRSAAGSCRPAALATRSEWNSSPSREFPDRHVIRSS